MKESGAQPLHTVYTSAKPVDESKISPTLAKLLKEPHLALFVNGDWLPIVPGMIIGLVTDRTKIDGIAPYRLMKVRTKPGKELIRLAAYSTNLNNERILNLGAKYTGQFASGTADADQAVDAAMATQKDLKDPKNNGT